VKSPTELAQRLARQWHQADTRECRLLDGTGWPLRLTIGKPAGRRMIEDFAQVRRHVERWRQVPTGRVTWEQIAYRGTAEPVELPVTWELRTPSEWVAATGDAAIQQDYRRLARLVCATDPLFQRLLVRRRHLHAERPEAEVIKAAELALALQPGCAGGVPLRALSVAGIDSKFFERNRRLMIELLDRRFDGAVSELGLEAFLGAVDENDHWLLLADLDGSLLPFSQLRVRDKELVDVPVPGGRVLVVENERCLHQLPALKETVAILGAGLNLTWLAAPWLADRKLAYWGDIDTWGLTMLARARLLRPELTPLLMDADLFKRHGAARVPEPAPAGAIPPEGLSNSEAALYRHLLAQERGRLEQEFLPKQEVVAAVTGWGGQ